MIKGYTGFVGQALVALKACELAADHLKGFEVVIYSASLKTRIKAIKLRHFHKVQVTIIKKRIPHHEILKHFAEARVYIGISLSDGISTSLLEAMATGCYPIQTNTSCANEWLAEYSGSIVSPHNPALLSQLLVKILPNKELLDTAAISNVSIINLTSTSEIIERQAKLFYNFE